MFYDARFCTSCKNQILNNESWHDMDCFPCLELAEDCLTKAFEKINLLDAEDKSFYEENLYCIRAAQQEALKRLLFENDIKIKARGESSHKKYDCKTT